MLPVVLTIAGSDNSAGAGAQADLKTISALGGYGVTAITCVVAEVPGKVSAVHPIPGAIVAEQIRLLFSAFPIAAIKTGMLYSTEIIRTVVETLNEFKIQNPKPSGASQTASGSPKGEGGRPNQSEIPIIVDPVMVATSGDPLLLPDAVARYRELGVDAQTPDFIDDMAAALADADLVICRAGAMTVAELAAVGVASVLVPFPHAVDDHQTTNARFLADRGAASLIPQAELSPECLANLISTASRESLAEQAARARALARPRAAIDVADVCEALANGGQA